MKKLLALSVLASSLLFGADVSGRWIGTITVEDKASGSEVSTPVEFQLEQHGDTVAGKVGRKDDKDGGTIREGKINGSEISLEVVSSEIVGPAKFTLHVVDEDSMQGNMTVRVEEGAFAGKVKLSRQK